MRIILLVCLVGSFIGGWFAHRWCSASTVLVANRTDPKPIADLKPMKFDTQRCSSKAEMPLVDRRAGVLDSKGPAFSDDLEQNRDWVRRCPDDALAWLRNAPEGPQRIAIGEIAFSALAETNPAAAMVLANDCFSSDTNDAAQNLLNNIVQQWAGRDLQSSFAWVMSKPPGGQRDHMLHRVAFVQSQTSPEDAARLVVQEMSQGEDQNEAAISVLYQWARLDPLAAMAWAEAFPGEIRDRAIAEVANVSAPPP